MPERTPDPMRPTREDLEVMFPPDEEDSEEELSAHANSAPDEHGAAIPFPSFAYLLLWVVHKHCGFRCIGTAYVLLQGPLVDFPDEFFRTVELVSQIANGSTAILGLLGFGLVLAETKRRAGVGFEWTDSAATVLSRLSRFGFFLAWTSIAGYGAALILGLFGVYYSFHLLDLPTTEATDAGVLLTLLFVLHVIFLALSVVAVKEISRWLQPATIDQPSTAEKSCRNCGRIVGASTAVCPKCMTKFNAS